MDAQFLHYCAFRFVFNVRNECACCLSRNFRYFFVQTRKSDQTMNESAHSVSQFHHNCKYLHWKSDVMCRLLESRFIENNNQYIWDDLLALSTSFACDANTCTYSSNIKTSWSAIFFVVHFGGSFAFWPTAVSTCHKILINDLFEFGRFKKNTREKERERNLMKEKSHPSINLTNTYISIWCF